MQIDHLLILCCATFFVSILGVVTGGHSMLTVPLLIFFGMPPAQAVATNRFANIFLAGAGSFNYLRLEKVPLCFTWPFILASIPGGAVGALLVLNLSGEIIQTTIGVFMLIILVMGLFFRDTGLEDRKTFKVSRLHMVLGTAFAFLVGLYWGFFGGGGMTLFTIFLTVSFGLSFLQSVGTSNVAMGLASAIAVIIFFLSGAVHLGIGLAMAAAMASGAWIGSYLSIRAGNVWIRRLFSVVILFFAIKLIFG